MWIAAFIAVNVASFSAFAWDKHCAINGMRRVRESDLLFLATFGGAFGALLSQQAFRHKTRKEPFRSKLYFAAAINMIAIALLVAAMISPELRAAIACVFAAWSSNNII